MSDMTGLLDQLLSPERSVDERMGTLRDLTPFLGQPAALRRLVELTGSEESIEVRRALLDVLAGVELPEFRNEPAWHQFLATTLAFDTEPDIRLLAAAALADIAPAVTDVELLLVESMRYEFDQQVQAVLADGLGRLPRLSERAVDALAAFAPIAPEWVQSLLVSLLAASPFEAGTRGLVAVLQAVTHPAVRGRVVAALAGRTAIDANAAAGIVAQMSTEADDDLWRGELAVLLGAQHVEAAVLSQALQEVSRHPERADLAAVLSDRLHANPDLVDRLKEAFAALPSSRQRSGILAVLSEFPIADLVVAGMNDVNASVRAAALQVAARQINQAPEVLETALVALVESDPITVLRRSAAEALRSRPSLSDESSARLVRCYAAELDADTAAGLAPLVLAARPQADGELLLLEAYLKLLDEMDLPVPARMTLFDRLRSISFSDAPGLAARLADLLSRTRTVEELRSVYPLLRAVTIDMAPLHAALLDVLYRFIDSYPEQPLDDIVRYLFVDAATASPTVQDEIARVVQLTGQTWLLPKASNDDQKALSYGEIRAAMCEGDTRRVYELVNSTFNAGLLRKSDLAKLYLLTLAHPGFEGSQQPLLSILDTAKVMTPEILAATLGYLADWPQASNCYGLSRYLQAQASGAEGYADSVRAQLTQPNYVKLCLAGSGPSDRARTQGYGWRDSAVREPWYGDWPLLELLDDHPEHNAILRSLLSLPVPDDGPIGYAVHFLVLAEMSRLRDFKVEDFIAVAGFFHRTAPGSERTRSLVECAACVATSIWQRMQPSSAAELAAATGAPELAAELFWYQIENWTAQGGAELDERVAPMQGVDLGAVSRLAAGAAEAVTVWLEAYLLLYPVGAVEGVQAPKAARRSGEAFDGPLQPRSRFEALARTRDLSAWVSSTPAPTDDSPLAAAWRALQEAASA